MAIKRYTFDAYFLPVPDGTKLPKNYWTEELWALQTLLDSSPTSEQIQPKEIDRNSGCWRIVYAVTGSDGNPV